MSAVLRTGFLLSHSMIWARVHLFARGTGMMMNKSARRLFRLRSRYFEDTPTHSLEALTMALY
jgi:hypothetical protein